MNLYHASNQNKDQLSYNQNNSEEYIDYDTCPLFEKLIKKQSIEILGFDIQDALYTYTSITDYAANNFGNYFYQVELEDNNYKAYICPNITDVVLDFKINKNFMIDFINKELGFLTCGQLTAYDVPASKLNKFLDNERRFSLKKEEDVFEMLEVFRNYFNNESKELGDELIKACVDYYIDLKKRIINNYIPHIKEIKLPYSGKEEVIIVTPQAKLKQCFIHTSTAKQTKEYQPQSLELENSSIGLKNPKEKIKISL